MINMIFHLSPHISSWIRPYCNQTILRDSYKSLIIHPCYSCNFPRVSPYNSNTTSLHYIDQINFPTLSSQGSYISTRAHRNHQYFSLPWFEIHKRLIVGLVPNTDFGSWPTCDCIKSHLPKFPVEDDWSIDVRVPDAAWRKLIFLSNFISNAWMLLSWETEWIIWGNLQSPNTLLIFFWWTDIWLISCRELVAQILTTQSSPPLRI